ncbi:MAG: helix-turn-helix transcriptional regulator [Candidatus Kapabacteria bacterium]|nr:helix-turn-helix transcriptional regulator [Candidatus Kapabacteria bacterium]
MEVNSNIIQINNMSASDICRQVSIRVKTRRLELNLTQIGLASRAGINIETYRKFERTGEISLLNLAKIGNALNVSSDFDLLFTQRQFQSIDELLKLEKVNRKRGKKA